MAELKDGLLVDSLVNQNIISVIERNVFDVKNIQAVVVHQTDNWSAEQTFNGWKSKDNIHHVGAHFVIDRGDTTEYKGDDGKIYQTAHLTKTCNHVGFIQSRCFVQKSCAIPKNQKISAEQKVLDYKIGWASRAQKIEEVKSYPDRYPMNTDSLGIEMVTKSDKNGVYPAPSQSQMQSLVWLLKEISKSIPAITLPTSANDPNSDIYAHGVIGRKQASEGKSAADDFLTVYTSVFGLNLPAVQPK